MKTPFIIINAKEDVVVRNSTSSDVIFRKVNNPKNKIVEIEKADHLNVSVDQEYVKIVVEETIGYFDSLLE